MNCVSHSRSSLLVNRIFNMKFKVWCILWILTTVNDHTHVSAQETESSQEGESEQQQPEKPPQQNPMIPGILLGGNGYNPLTKLVGTESAGDPMLNFFNMGQQGSNSFQPNPKLQNGEGSQTQANVHVKQAQGGQGVQNHQQEKMQ